ncbi:p-loop containing nucleoside triphosphate hydrolase [Venustampulla echinocandica]|uniref:dynamin GTPase n=1 Tax=Venustampulla echinocandica TaxID=2656787 RepID=A0A370TCN5_9HELO|nr:p-loop containing nucleoside triphosphate hydrolase [Venustampulla echinocandica]RDL31991.1 p-loop containing nucleoside triphosphate hydrolase [Venustampulla echinocandica]
MSGRLLSASLRPLGRRVRVNPQAARQSHHRATSSAGGLLRSGSDSAVRAARRRAWPPGYFPFSNAVVVRNASFVRILPNLLLKFARIPALFAGMTITGLAYVQYQATQAGNYALDVFGRTKDTVTEVAGGIFGSAKDIADQTRKGWENSKEQVELPEWMQKILRIHEEIGEPRSDSGGEGGGGQGPGGEPPKQSRMGTAAAGATAAAYGYDQSEEEDLGADEDVAKDDQMMVLTKKMIEIRSILQTVGQSNALTLPSIVVIGSQSSGKSSVLEAIVGHEFLPKGSNMITRRPIELTLVNTPSAQAEYGEFPALGLGKITDFSHIQRTLTELNLAVPESECVSDDPIQLTISSPNVPDLSLIDLPGYIQVVGHDQPAELKQKIADLCDKYIQPPNVILAISAADVDLANSTALRASRRVDPRGERTIGVVTKMDLVDPRRGASILNDRKYPLRLGYVGVIPRVPAQSTSLFKKGSGSIASAITRNENAFFSAHPLEYGAESGLSVGTTTLRKKLMQVLEQTMSASLQSTSDAIHQELEEATYEFKVQYNDRPLSAESYLAESLDAFKHSFKEFTENFGRPQVREMLKEELDQRVLDLLAAKYWNKPVTNLLPAPSDPDSLADLPKADPESLYWHRKLDGSTSALTKLGIGRLATTVVANAIQTNVDRLISQSTFASHPFARQAITEAAAGILNERFYSTSDQVENCIKPYKFEIDVEDAEWARGREHAAGALKNELTAVEDAVKAVEKTVGGKRKLKDVISFVDKARKGEVIVEGGGASGAGGFSSDLLQKGQEALFLSDRATLLKFRLQALKSTQCASKSNKYYCPEIFLDVVSTKLVSTAVLFLNVELLSEFVYQFPRELDVRLGRGLSHEEVERFAREDPRVRAHLDVIKRKELLELVLEKMEGVRDLETSKRERERARRKRADGSAIKGNEGKGRSGWGLF